MTRRFAGQTALVTAGAGGIGAAVAKRLGEGGAGVALLDLAKAEGAAQNVCDSICSAGGDAMYVCGNATVRSEAEQGVAAVLERWGRLDMLINVVGGTVDGAAQPIWEMSDDVWHRTLALNLDAMFHCTKAALPTMMEQRRGRIVNMASIAWGGHGSNPAYATAKAGVVAFTRSVSQQLAPYDVTVNTVAPGLTRTGVFQRLGVAVDGTGLDPALTASIPLGRMNEPEDIAAAVTFLVSDDARNITGQVITVAGGQNPSL